MAHAIGVQEIDVELVRSWTNSGPEITGHGKREPVLSSQTSGTLSGIRQICNCAASEMVRGNVAAPVLAPRSISVKMNRNCLPWRIRIASPAVDSTTDD